MVREGSGAAPAASSSSTAASSSSAFASSAAAAASSPAAATGAVAPLPSLLTHALAPLSSSSSSTPAPFMSAPSSSSSSALLLGAAAGAAPSSPSSPVKGPRFARVHRTLPLPFAELPYNVEAWSSYSSTYHPKNILVDRPTDQSSRWSSASNNQLQGNHTTQYITLKLDKVAILSTITFGKYHKGHVCNLREFKVFAGLTADNMVEVLHSGLRNDDEAETFPVRHRVGEAVLPCQYVKIVPLLAWGANFNFSIWFVLLRGIAEQTTVQNALTNYMAFREREALRLCLKHFRQRNYLDIYEDLQERAHVQLEDPMLTDLHHKMVIDGSFAAVETALVVAAAKGLFDEYISQCTYKAHWRKIVPTDASKAPRMRGGHQMCLDTERKRIYLFGGWDGHYDLDDLWVFDLTTEQWTCLSTAVSASGGPTPRSCHKICLDRRRGLIYTLGGYVDPEHRLNQPMPCDFYVYDIERARWTCLSKDVAADGGPGLIYDHQMCYHGGRDSIYVFGGRTVSTRTRNGTEDDYSGMYCYHVPTGAWRLMRGDEDQSSNSPKVKSRIGHSMLLNSRENMLYIFAGQRNKEYLSDFYVYDIEHNEVVEMSRDVSKNGGPDAGFTQRATIDLDQNEIYLLSGLVREKITSQETVKNSFWVYNTKTEQWSKVYHNENADANYWLRMEALEPCPRFAHQLVYDYTTKVHYLFGGNPGEAVYAKARLDDFWELKLTRPTPADILRKTLFLVRRLQFREMCQGPRSMEALRFLQQKVAEVVDHSDAHESAQFRLLSAVLFQKGGSGASDAPDCFAQRTAVYEEILQFFPPSYKQPKDSLIDLVPM